LRTGPEDVHPGKADSLQTTHIIIFQHTHVNARLICI
jgi:hypothetical protein